MLWSDFLRKPENAFDAHRATQFLRDCCALQNTIDAEEAADVANLIAFRLIQAWLNEQPDPYLVVLGCDFQMPFYKNLHRGVVLVALGWDSGLSPDTIGVETMLEEMVDFSTGMLVRHVPLASQEPWIAYSIQQSQ
jgi:hypothetical protein